MAVAYSLCEYEIINTATIETIQRLIIVNYKMNIKQQEKNSPTSINSIDLKSKNDEKTLHA